MAFTVSPYEFDRDGEVVALLHRVFKPWVGEQEYFDWKYNTYRMQDCPFPTAWVMEHEGRIIAFNGYIPRKVKAGHETVWGLQSFDTATDPDFRGNKLFEQLQKQVYQIASKANIAWIYGWTSEIGFKVFTQKVGWTVWGHQGYLQRVLDTRHFLLSKYKNPLVVNLGSGAMDLILRPARITWKGEIREEKVFSPRVDALCMEAMSHFDMVAIRDVAYLNWRLSNPQANNRLLCAYEGQNMVSYLVLARSAKEEALDILDCLSISDEGLLSLLSRVEQMATESGSKIIRFRVNERHRLGPVFKKAGYFWSRTRFPMVGLCMTQSDENAKLIWKTDKTLHWTVLDRNE